MSRGAWRQGSAPPGDIEEVVALEERWRLAVGRYRQAVWACFARRCWLVRQAVLAGAPGGRTPGHELVCCFN